MHAFSDDDRRVLGEVLDWVVDRLTDPAGTPSAGAPSLPPVVGPVVGSGVGVEAAWRMLRDQVLPTAFPADHPRYLAFVGGAPTTAAVLADAVLSAASVYGGSELEAGAVVRAERAAARWLCDLAGYPPESHGVFVSGGSLANLSALVAARHAGRRADGSLPDVIVAGGAAHSSVAAAAGIMGCTVVTVGAPDTRLCAADLKPVLDELPATPVAVVATAGATNTGVVDELDELAATCAERGTWLHVDAAYGGAGLLVPQLRPLFAGIERADSITIDPHKWLFTPFDCAGVLYRDPAPARAAHTQRAPYLEPVDEEAFDNPADHAVHLTRRARGLPLWFSLVANGADGYAAAVAACLAAARAAARRIEASPVLELVADPQLSVVLFRRRGWAPDDYRRWSSRARSSGLALVTPTTFAGRTVLRLCFVNPRTSADDVELVLASLEA
ncbi:pyridoxal phosphate-dependent decarboxylase family protein [Nocardioides kongjuensis]|uniref:Glutamate/tyrosine decarboxylase-like PLP-dependent enzyme n=1 Tax=Nocardioides kongjuensis TaxID=349522 RepID=A0A852RD56_9ACTN|nr:glutamate/tyrosine decarboxylase-like PLP-dependent enzyme [Nocardioides kongjuensis]